MKQERKVIGAHRTLAFRLDPTLTSEETIVLRALATGQTDRQVCKELRMDPTSFLRMMRDMREKIGMSDNVSLIEWGKRLMKGVDQRIDRPERYARPA
jgi:DNA-binding NarL/FixJ family response regulator